MSLNPLYVTAPSLQSYFADKDSGEALSGGKIFLYEDVSRTTPKAAFSLQGSQANYTYQPLPNPIVLSAAGTIQDNNGNDLIPYWYPYDADGNQQLYYIVVQSATGVPQFTRQAWPNPETGNTVNQTDTINFVPNGQFLAHTNLPNNALVAGSNIIAQGGFTVELDSGATSTNTLTFVTEPFTENPPQSPRFTANLICTVPNSLEAAKYLRLKWNDVNKFSAFDQTYTYAFWAQGTTDIPFNLQVFKFFGTGGSPSASVTIPIVGSQITPTGTFFNFTVDFGSNAGYNLGSNNDDFVAIDIMLPTNVSFNTSFTDFILTPSTGEALVDYPIQTNASMLSLGVAGWMDLPNPDGSDLYLPLVLTRKGMAWERSQIGTVVATLGSVPATSSSNAVTNLMNADGSSFVTSAYSHLGIPYSRLSSYLISKSPLTNTPMFGTGSNFATAYAAAGNTSLLRLTVNSAGASSAAASDGTTGWTIGSIVTYNGSATGSASLTYNAYSNVANTVLAVGSFVTPNAAASAGTSGFTVTTLNNFTGLLAQQSYAITILCVAASALAQPSAPGLYVAFSNASTNYYIWFQITNETDPAPGGKTGIKLVLDAGYTAQDVANLVRETINAYQISTITIAAAPTAGQYWLFSTNPASPANYYVWYTVDGAGSDPALGSKTGIKVALVGADTAVTTKTKTLTAINAYQFAAPNFAGMFLRGYDPTALWDKDATTRWSSISGLSGANLGTFEYSQLLSHLHSAVISQGGATPATYFSGVLNLTAPQSANTNLTGGTETRPVNAYVNYAIRY